MFAKCFFFNAHSIFSCLLILRVRRLRKSSYKKKARFSGRIVTDALHKSGLLT